MTRARLSLALGLCISPSVTLAYELNTHALVTLHSFYISALNDSRLQDSLGLTPQGQFGDVYYDNTPSTVRSRYGKFYENSLIEEHGNAPYTIEYFP